ncbi:hypothetical protein GEV33_001321 [Tenebrio molitor]|uniref:Uncharacterized protein n=1 Tax=Tenebrio molitor TaxID=7067 RepID=A0A8J6HMI1_TENMO|nr:hypothetical protein GEV33_001321 [Tenebrio molitor]
MGLKIAHACPAAHSIYGEKPWQGDSPGSLPLGVREIRGKSTCAVTSHNGRESSGARLDRECRSPRRSQLVRTGMLPPPVTRSANPAHPGVNRGIDNRIPWKSHVRSGYVMGSCADVASKSPEGTR